MRVLTQLQNHLRHKGLRATLNTAFRHYVFYHWELLWMERDLVSPVPPHNLKPSPPTHSELTTLQNVHAFARYFGDRIDTMRDMVLEGHTGIIHRDPEGHVVAFIWGCPKDYHDHHFYGCWFPVKPGEFFEFGGELTRAYWGTTLSVDLQLDLWKAMHAQGCDKVVDVCESHNIPALKLHLRMGYAEQGRVTHVYCLFGRWKFFRQSRYEGSRLAALRKPTVAPTPVGAA